MEQKYWYVVAYDISDPKRWRKTFKLLHGYGRHLQLSIFRCRLTVRDQERLRWELEKILDPEDKLLIMTMCDQCGKRTESQNRPESWVVEDKKFGII